MKSKPGKVDKFLSLTILFIVLSYGLVTAQAEEFTDSDMGITIDKAVKIAIENNLQLKAERERLGIARARLAIVRPFLNPELESETASSNREGDRGYSLKISQEFEVGGKRACRREVAKINIEKVRRDIENEERELAAGVRRVFYRGLLLQKQVELMDKLSGLNEELVKDTIDRFQAGYISQLEVNLAKIQLQEVSKKRAEFSSELSVSLLELKRLLGSPPESELKINGSLDYYPVELKLDRLINYSLANRPDLKSLEFGLRGAEKEVSLWQAERWPDIKLFSSFDRAPDKEELTRVGVSIPLPIFDRKRGQIEEAKTQKRKADFELADIEQLIAKEVTAAYSEFNLSRERLKLYQEEIMDLIEEGLGLSRGAYQRGEVGFLEILLTQEKFVQTKISYLEALYAYNLSVVKLEKAIGGRLIDVR